MKPRFLLFFMLILTSCVSSKTKFTLSRAESLMAEFPDSALTIVAAIPQEELKTRSIRARHALLTTMAQDKCNKDVEEDATIREAFYWYQNHGTKIDRLKATYYLGAVQQNEGKDIDAAILFSSAESLGEELKEHRWLSLCYQHLSTIFSRNYDRVRAMFYARKSLLEAELAKDSLMADFCRLDIATQHVASSQLDSAELLLNRVVSKCENKYLYSYASRLLARVFLFHQAPDYEKAGILYDEIQSQGAIHLVSQDYGYLGLISYSRGEQDLSDYYFRKAEQSMLSSIDSSVYYSVLANVYDLKGVYKESNDFFSKAMAIQDRIVSEQLEQSITHALENHYQNQTNLEIAKGRFRFSLFLLIGALLVSVIVWLIARLRRAKREIVEKMAQIQDFSSDLEHLQMKDSATRDLLNLYTQDKIKSLNSLANAYFSWDSENVRQKEKRIGDQTKEELVDSFQKQLEGFRKKDGFYSSLENALNVSYDNIMIRAREELKQEKKVNIELVILYLSGFSAKSICFLKDLTEATVRMRKTRLKQFFASLPDHRGDEFIMMLERKQ